MHPDTFKKFAILWLALWFGVIVPGHKRGLVLLPGAPGNAAAASNSSDEALEPCPLAEIMALDGSCCPSSKPSDPDTPMPVTHCAICYLTGVLDVPPAPDFAPRPLELVQVLPWPEPVAQDTIGSTRTYLGRAPPTA